MNLSLDYMWSPWRLQMQLVAHHVLTSGSTNMCWQGQLGYPLSSHVYKSLHRIWVTLGRPNTSVRKSKYNSVTSWPVIPETGMRQCGHVSLRVFRFRYLPKFFYQTPSSAADAAWCAYEAHWVCWPSGGNSTWQHHHSTLGSKLHANFTIPICSLVDLNRSHKTVKISYS